MAESPEELVVTKEAIASLIVLGLLVYSYMGATLYTLAKKLNHAPRAWFAWVPIANVVLLCELAKRPNWWALLIILPAILLPPPISFLASSLFSAILWMEVAERRQQPRWVGILIIVPMVNIFVPGFLAFVDRPLFKDFPPSNSD